MDYVPILRGFPKLFGLMPEFDIPSKFPVYENMHFVWRVKACENPYSKHLNFSEIGWRQSLLEKQQNPQSILG